MIQETIGQNDLLYHAVHGLCRVEKINKQTQSGKEVLSYSLVPKTISRTKTRFTISLAGMEASGFHALISLKEANKILEYLKKGDVEEIPSKVATKSSFPSIQQNQIWDMAQAVLSLAYDKFEARDQRKRQLLERSVKGLVGELALVFKITSLEMAVKIQKSLGNSSKINPSVLTALDQASEKFRIE